jgi:hypothetical protein
MKRLLTCLLMCCLAPVMGLAQKMFLPDSIKREIRAIYASSKITVDGRLTEADWQKAMPASHFTQIDPYQGSAAYFKTSVSILYNESSLYFGFIAYDTVGRNHYRVPDLKRDFPFSKHDLVGVTVDGFNDQRNSMTFFTNPYGAQRDYQAYDDTYFDVDWNGLWKVRTLRTDSAWIAEIEIPWKTLRYKENGDSSFYMGINFRRTQRTSNEKSTWSPYPRSVGFDRVAYAGVVTGLRPPASSSNIQINPFSLLHYNQSYKGGDGKKPTPKIGGDVKWAITPNLVIDATVNTDFAQADADNLVNNLSRFSIFFPEKRQFFLENASLFGVGLSPGDNDANLLLQPFFSRRIGLDSANSPLPVDGGVRAVYRSLKRSIGLIAVRQRGTEQSPLQHFFVGRYTENLGKKNRLGFIVSGKTTAAHFEKQNHAHATAGVDGFFRLTNTQTLNIMLLTSTNFPKKNGGFGGYAQYAYKNNAVSAWWTEALIDKHFDPQTGFVSRQDVIATLPGFQLNIRKKWIPYKKIVRDFAPGLNTEWYHQASSGKLSEQVTTLTPFYFNFIKGGYIKFSTLFNHQHLTSAFRPLGILIDQGKYNYSRFQVAAESNAANKIYGTLTFEWGGYFNGRLRTTRASIAYTPAPYVSLTMNANNHQVTRVGRENRTKNINLVSVETRLALNPRMQLTSLYQRNSINKESAYNIRYSWEYQPMSYVHLVFNKQDFTTTVRESEANAILKLSYLKQF